MVIFTSINYNLIPRSRSDSAIRLGVEAKPVEELLNGDIKDGPHATLYDKGSERSRNGKEQGGGGEGRMLLAKIEYRRQE